MSKSLAGTTLGKYRVVELIGKGAMAEVYKAYHPSLNRHVAIKRLHAFLVEKADMLERFQREAQHIAALRHPNIVQVFDYDMADPNYYMVMEYIEGQTLKEILASARAGQEHIELEKAIRIARDVGAALAYAHEQGVIHRDVKPANIMLEEAGRTVLADFGLARLLAGPQHTSTGMIVGTPAYMSPEQAGGESGDERSDIYALGALLYELATGCQPFAGETPIAVIFKHINAPVPSPRAINSSIPAGLEQVIFRALEKDPAHRYLAASEMVEDLDIIAQDRMILESDAPDIGSRDPAAHPLELVCHMLESGQSFVLQGKDRYVIGRLDGAFEPDLDLGVFQGAQMGVSRLHAEIEVLPDRRVRIYDMDSTNGTWVNGQPVSPTEPSPLNQGDLIALGKCMIQVVFLS